ncbi:MAG: phage integrase SAM-like domain-containing protein [Flavobacteriia bacterium]|nr:phage integrase SAM-like domain-containing protein [Flavobacteriia bacterium]
MAKVAIKLDKRDNCKKPDGTYPLVLVLSHHSKTRTISLKYYFLEEQWDGVELQPIDYPNAKHVGAKIRSYLSKAEILIIDKKLELDSMPISELKVYIQGEIFSTSSTPIRVKENFIRRNIHSESLIKYGDIKISRLRVAKKHGNANAIKDALASIKKFTKREEIYFSDIDQNFLKDYVAFCNSRGNKPNTIRAYLSQIKALFGEAMEDDVINILPFPKFKIPNAVKTKKRSLRINDISEIRKLELKPKSAIWNARNYFLFMFNNMGLNFIDLVKMKKNQILQTKYNKNKKLVEGRIVYKRSKTKGEFSVKLTSESIDILNEYNIGSKLNDDFIFPMGFEDTEKGIRRYKQHRKRVNVKLGDLAKMANIDEDITTYYARHSWATIAKRKLIPISVISEGLGHADLKTTQVYLDSFDDDVLDQANEDIVG